MARRLQTAALALLVTVAAAAEGPAGDTDNLEQSRALYAGLQSYSDTGVIVREYGRDSSDTYTFTTSFRRAPRHFLLDFRKTGDRYVIWADVDAFHVWVKSSAQQYDYPNPNNAEALTGSGYHTQDVAMKIPPLLYAKAGLMGFFSILSDMSSDGIEDIDGRHCQRLIGKASDHYAATGKEVNVRKVTIWIDSETQLVRRVREQWPPLPGQRAQVTTTFEPHANPELDEKQFRFVPPAAK